jgi:hypothetical protein
MFAIKFDLVRSVAPNLANSGVVFGLFSGELFHSRPASVCFFVGPEWAGNIFEAVSVAHCGVAHRYAVTGMLSCCPVSSQDQNKGGQP